jgi:hypothetical protein
MADKFVSRLLLIGLAVVILIVLITQYNSSKPGSKTVSERYAEPQLVNNDQPIIKSHNMPIPKQHKDSPTQSVGNASAGVEMAAMVLPSESQANEDFKAIDFNTENKLPTDCFPRDRLTAEDLLPKDAANLKWAQVNPAGQGDVKDQNLLSAGFHIGINTVGQTLRNPNYQIRSEPPNPRMNIGPWNQTTIEFDNSRRHFEVGDC